MEMRREQQVTASPVASGPSPLETPRGSQTPHAPWEPSREKSRSLEEEGGGGSAPSPHPRALPLLPLAILPLPVVGRRRKAALPGLASLWGGRSDAPCWEKKIGKGIQREEKL